MALTGSQALQGWGESRAEQRPLTGREMDRNREAVEMMNRPTGTEGEAERNGGDGRDKGREEREEGGGRCSKEIRMPPACPAQAPLG